MLLAVAGGIVMWMAVEHFIAPPVQAQGSAPESIFVNTRIYKADAKFTTAEALAVSHGKITAIGSASEIRKMAGPQTRVFDLQGKTVVPGLEDNHLHGAGGGPGVDLSRARMLDEVLKNIGDRVKKAETGEVVVTNADWHEAQLKEQRVPYRKDLDKVAPSTPVVVVRGGHEYILNTAALNKWDINKNTPEPAGGRITRGENGELNGELVDTAKSFVKLPPPKPPTLEDLVAEHKKLNAAGLTSIRYPGASVEQYRTLQEMQKRGLLTIRVTQLMRPPARTPQQLREMLAQGGVKPDEGDEWLKVAGVKLAVDGGFEGGWMRDLYQKPYDEGGTYRGLNTFPQAVFNEVVKEANRLGWRVATHAVGDAAIDEVLTAYEAADAEKSIVGKRWAIEHGFIPRDDQFPRMKKLGLEISAQDHLYLAGPSLVKMWGKERAAWVTPMRKYIDEGLPVSGGTDAPVVPYPPLWVFYHFVTRDTITGGVLGPDQRISRQEALRVLTVNNAHLTFEENTKGSLEVGKLADFIVLPEDLMIAPAKTIESMGVLMTVVGGKPVYQDDKYRPAISGGR
jgi:predicted amidohydrolase YtcJ